MGEDELILRAHEDILSVHPNALLILAPRHPERRDDILDLINSCEFTSSVRSKGQTPNKKTQVYLFDTIGEMGLAFRLAALTFVCGSLVKGLTGHNPLEPARLGSAVLTGGNTASFSETYNAMFSFGAARRVLSPEIIGKEITALFSDQDVLENLREKARRYAESRDDVLTYVWDELQPLLPHASAS
jgi:3-deoxy-D-manno-octulosonic-acid transferase